MTATEKDTKTQDLINRLVTYSKCLAGMPVNDKGDSGPLKAPLETAMRKVLLDLGDSDVDKLDVVFAAKLLLRLWDKFFPSAPIPWIPHATVRTDDLSQLDYVHFEHAFTSTGLEAIVRFGGLGCAIRVTMNLLPPDAFDQAVAEGDSSAPAKNSFGVQAAATSPNVIIRCPQCDCVFRFRLSSRKEPVCPHCEKLATVA
jgi:hypothetical protein